MVISIKEVVWHKCAACGGTGGGRPLTPQMVAAFNAAGVSQDVLGKMVQGVCLVCGGRGQYSIKEEVGTADVSVWGWLWNLTTGWEPNEYQRKATGQPAENGNPRGRTRG